MTALPWRAILPWAAILAYGAVLSALYVLRPPCPDLATFDYIGWVVSRGGTPYVDVIEQNFPGAMWLHALANELFGPRLWAFRIIDLALLWVGSSGLYLLAVMGSGRLAGFIVVPLYQTLYVSLNVWIVGQRDILGAHVLVLLGALAARRWAGGSRSIPAVLGAAAALVCLTRPTYALYLPLLLGADLLLRRRNGRTLVDCLRDVALQGATFTAVLGFVALAAWPSGALAGWYRAAILFNTRLYSQSAGFAELARPLVLTFNVYVWLVLLATLGVLTWWRRGERNALAAALALGLLALLSMLVQGKGFGYHLAAVYPIMALFNAELVSATIARARSSRAAVPRVLAVAVCSLSVLMPLKKAYGALRHQLDYLTGRESAEAFLASLDIGLEKVSLLEVARAARYAEEHTRPDETVLTWHRGVLINYLAERRLPTRLATVGMLDVAARGGAEFESWVDSFARTLSERPPALVFTYNEQLPHEHALLWDERADAPATRMVREALTTRYRRTARFGALDVYALQ